MSDIPVGSPPAPPGRHAAPSGWYPDPVTPGHERYWDGWQWSRTTRVAEQAGPPQPARPPAGPAAPPPGYGHPGSPPGPHQPGSQPGPYGAYQPGSQPGPYGAYPTPGAPHPAYAPTGGKPPLLTADGVRVAGWWWRALAIVIDAVIVNVLTVIAALPIYRRMMGVFSAWWSEALRAAQTGQPPPAQPPLDVMLPQSDQFLLAATSAGIGMVYIVAFLRWKGATPGKLICGLRVVPVDQGRLVGPLGWLPSVVRAAVWVLPSLTAALLLVRLIDVLLPLRHPKRQALHDLAARTQVVKIT